MMHRVILAPVALLLLVPRQPDEGQWLPSQIREMDWQELQARGMELTRDEFWHPETGGVLSAAVHLGGCTASFVSADGLLVTNHHCGFSAVQQLSTLQNNHLQNGFAAADREAELPAPGMTARVLRRIEDVTERVHAAQADATSDLERFFNTQRVIGELVAAGQREPNTVCSVASLYEGRAYHLYYRTVITDVRLVYAPPRSMGEFGGDVDNWEWPRHTGDFSFFRAYVAPDGTSRPYREGNVPYRPSHHLQVSAAGVQEGDLVMILGYPGRTERYATSLSVRERQGFYYPKRLDLLTRILDVLDVATRADEARALALSSLIKSLANVQKNAAGMVWGLERNAVVERKLRDEAGFRNWLQEDPQRQSRYGQVLEDLLAADEDARQTQQKDLIVELFLLGRIGGVTPLLQSLVDVAASAAANPDGMVPPRDLDYLASEYPGLVMETIQAPLMAIFFEELRLLPEDQRVPGTEVLADTPIEEAIATLLAGSTLMTPDGRRVALAAGNRAILDSEDPLLVLARGLAAERREFLRRERQKVGRRIPIASQWIEAQEQWRGKSFYPDANSTLRVSIATVKGYQPRDGVLYTPHTTVAGILTKETGQDPFASPTQLLYAAPERDQSRFYDPRIGDVPVCFLADGDTTGGNSGSPVINGKGELVGLNFDRAFEAVAGDYGWNPDRSRNISVDIRFVLWVLEDVLPAPELLRELGI